MVKWISSFICLEENNITRELYNFSLIFYVWQRGEIKKKTYGQTCRKGDIQFFSVKPFRSASISLKGSQFCTFYSTEPTWDRERNQSDPMWWLSVPIVSVDIMYLKKRHKKSPFCVKLFRLSILFHDDFIGTCVLKTYLVQCLTNRIQYL